ncbi:MAG: ATP-binding protein [Deltaproteobacteria bacterium]|nr:ATP-binding protein [Deltaproteobacteria bacterium]
MDLLDWSHQPDRKPLVLRGARQTGKTASIREFGKRFTLFVELNLERHEDRRLVAACRSADELVAALQVRAGVARFPARTLLFLDEVQESPEVIGWLRFLHESHPELWVAAAGSLMDVRLQDRGFSFPVGRVTFRYLHPFSFLEFLGATSRVALAEQIDASMPRAGEGTGRAKFRTLPPPVHEQALDAFRQFLLVGGMPEAVRRWAEEASPVAVRQVHLDLTQALAADLHKYAGARDTAHLEAAFAMLPHHAGRRFKYERFAPGFASLRMKTALGLLEGAMLCHRALPTTNVAPPLAVKPRAAPKLLPLDVGMTLAALGVPWTDLRTLPLHTLLDGRVAELIAGQLLRSADRRTGAPTWFWVRDSPQANAELDYLVVGPAGLFPVEVKSGASGTLKSLHQFLWRSGTRVGIRLHGGGWSDEQLHVKMGDRPLAYRLLSLPLYLAERVPELALP